ARLRYLGVAVGSEASCMVNPKVCWIANTRTVWAHLVIKCGGNIAKAKRDLGLFTGSDATREVNYKKWAAIHNELSSTIALIAKEDDGLANHRTVHPGSISYLWAGAIASGHYELHNLKKSR